MHRAHALYAASSGSEADLITRYAKLIDRIARRLSLRVGIPAAFDDLWSAGALGLLDAAKRFDAARDVRFESFAEHRIRGAMLDELRRMDHLPRRLRAQTDQVNKTRQKLSHSLGHEPSAEELASELKMDLGELGEIEVLALPHMPLAQNLSMPSDEPPQDDQLARAEQIRVLTKAIEGLSERLQMLMSLHYVEGLTYREIAQILEVSEPRVCQLHAEAISKIRAALTAHYQADQAAQPQAIKKEPAKEGRASAR